MPLYIGDYLKDTGHLTVTEHGAYLLLIMRYWEDGGLPADERMIARYSRMTPDQWAECREVLAALFEDGWKHKRIDEEMAKAEEIIGKRRAAAQQRHSKSNADAHQVESTSTYTRVPPSPAPSSLRSDVSAPVRPTPRSELETVLDGTRAAAVLDHRRLIRKPLTAHAAKLLAGKFGQCQDPNAAADAMISNGWQGFEPEWLEHQARGSPHGAMSQADVFAKIAEAPRHEVQPEPPEDRRGLREAIPHLSAVRAG